MADSFRAIEPWQRGSGSEPLTVALHIADLHELIQSHCSDTPHAIVGASWGAMLALAYAAAHPDTAGPLVLVGCGTFDKTTRAEIGKTLEARTDDDLRQRLERLPQECPDPSEQMKVHHQLSERLYSYEPIASEEQYDLSEPFDGRGAMLFAGNLKGSGKLVRGFHADTDF